MTEKTATRHCVACEAGAPALPEVEAQKRIKEIPSWELLKKQPMSIRKKFKFKNFLKSMEFVNEIAVVAETEGHHPDIDISYNKVEITLVTHAVKGLSDNDFIMAAEIDKLQISPKQPS